MSIELRTDLEQEEVAGMKALDGDDLTIVARLLNKIQKTCEKRFAHGKFLKPVTIVYDGEGPVGSTSGYRKTATFLCLSIFWLNHLRERTPVEVSTGHPSRGLLQSRYRLESTERRDREQVIAKSRRHEDRVVHVPQLWALLINQSLHGTAWKILSLRLTCLRTS